MIDFNKPVQTRDGRKVRILCTDTRCVFTVIGLILGDKHDEPESWTLTGRCYADCCNSATDLDDLMNVPERVDKWFNLYSEEAGMAFHSKAESVEAGSPWSPKMLALVKVTFEDGKPVAVVLEDLQ